MEPKSINLRIFIGHTSAIQADAPISEVKAYFNNAGTEFAAILKNGKALGLISKEAVFDSSKSSQHAQDYISAHGIICSTDEPIESCIHRALARPESYLLDDIVLVDESSHFLGLITPRSFIQIQKNYHNEHIDLLSSALSLKSRKIDDLENDLKHSKNQLDENREMVKRIKEMRSEFIASFSNEAQAPTTAIKDVLNLFAATKPNIEQQQIISSARANTRTLLRLIASTLDYAKIETNSLKLTETSFSPLDAIQACIEATKEEAVEKDLIIQCDHSPIPDKVLGDELRFKQIVENLITRALDETSAGGIQMTVSRRSIREKLLLQVEIRDSNTGCSLSEAKDLFEPQLTNTQDTHVADLGTLVSERIANKMGGCLQLTQNDDGGSQFTLELPFKVLAARPTSMATAEINDPEIKVLIVDDNRLNLDIARRFLLKLNCKPTLVNSGLAALRKLKEQPIDCIFLDCQMPDLSGFETTELIRSGECGTDKANVFICAMPAHDSATSRQQCIAAGMNYYMPKPVSRSSFEKAIQAWNDEHSKAVVRFKDNNAAG